MKRLDIMVTKNQETALRKAKLDTGLTMSDLVRRTLDRYLEEVKDDYRTMIPQSFCPVCFSPVLPTPTGYLCRTDGELTILQVISERVAEMRRKKRDESQML